MPDRFPPLTTTAIGSTPFEDVDAALDLIARTCPDLPHWPQFVHRHPREDMVLQVADGLPLLRVNEAERKVDVATEGREEALTEFYEHFMAGDLDWFAVPREAEAGLTALLDRARRDPNFGPQFLKGEVTGPITFGQSIRTPEDKSLLDDPDLADTVVKGLGAKAAWVAEQIRQTGRTPLIFFDEPGLTGLGSAFSTLNSDQVLAMLNEAAQIVRSHGQAYLGVHVCGNSDWGLLAQSELDVINFDAFSYLDHFLLYPDQIQAFYDRGGFVAWGIAPTGDTFTGDETPEMLAERLRNGWAKLAGQGIDPELIRERTLITPACGVGAMDADRAWKVYELLPQIAELLRG